MHSEDAKQEHRIRKEMMPREVFEARYVYGLRKNEVRYFFFLMGRMRVWRRGQQQCAQKGKGLVRLFRERYYRWEMLKVEQFVKRP